MSPLNATVLANNGAVIKDVDEPDEPAEETANCYMITTPASTRSTPVR